MSYCLNGFPRFSLTIHLYHPSLPVGLLDYIPCPYRAVVDKCLLINKHLYVRVKGSIGEYRLCVHPYFSNSVPHVLFIVHLVWTVLEMGGKWPYSCCFVGYCFQNLFSMTCSILVQFPSSFFSTCLISIYVVHPYSRISTTAACKKLHFILSDRFWLP